MERLAFGYRGFEVRNLLGEKILEYRDFINEVAEKHYGVKVNASFDGLVFPAAGALLRIRLEGKLNSLESTIDDIFEKFGLPDIVDTPYGFFDKLFGCEDVTTKPAYKLMKSIFKTNNIRTEEFIGNVCLRRK